MSVVASRSSTDRAIVNGRPPFASRRMTSTGRGIWRLMSVNSVACAILEGMFFRMAKRHGRPIRSRFCPEIQPIARAVAFDPTDRLTGVVTELATSHLEITHGQAADAACGGDERLWSPRRGALIP